MKQTFIILITLICAVLAAQTQQIPDIEITGEARIKLPMRQQSMARDDVKVAPDSLPLLIPHGAALQTKKTLEQTGRRAWVHGELGSRTSARLRASWYTGYAHLPFLRFDMANARIGKGWASQDHDLYVLGRLNKLVLGGDLYYAHSTAPGHFVDAYRVMAINNTDRLDLGEWHFSGMNTSLNLDVLKARTDAMNWKHTNPGIAHRHHLRLHDLYFGNEFILAGGVPAFSTSTRISSLAWFTDIDLVLATDFTRLLPSLRFSYPLARRDGSSILIANTPGIHSSGRIELLRAYPWAVQPPVMKQALAPLDLQFHYQKQFPTVAAGAAGGDMSRGINLSIAHRFAYLYNKPVLIDGGFASLPLLSFSDQWENHTSVRLSGMLQGFALSQSLSLDVIHTKYNNFRLRHYSPLLSAVTNVTHSFGDLETGLSFTQEYLAQDHLGKKLNHVFKMDIIAGYNVTPDLAIYARILDVFNSPGKVWNSIPGTGREAFLGVKYRVR